MLIGENTFTALLNPGTFSIRMVDYVAVKGKATAIRLYEVLDALEEEQQKAKEATKELLGAAMKAYINRDFSLAKTLFKNIIEMDSQDTVPAIFTTRCDRYQEQAPSEDWQGYEKLVHK